VLRYIFGIHSSTSCQYHAACPYNTNKPIMPYFFIFIKISCSRLSIPTKRHKISNKRNKADDAPQTPLPRRSGRHIPNTPVSYSDTQRKGSCSAVAIAKTPIITNASLDITSSPVNDQRQLKTILESHVSSAFASAGVGGLTSPTSNSEIEAGTSIQEVGKESVVDPNKTCRMSLNMGFATLFFHATIKKVLDKNTGKERPWLMFSDIRTNPHDACQDRPNHDRER
jgi:hypothetical protein